MEIPTLQVEAPASMLRPRTTLTDTSIGNDKLGLSLRPMYGGTHAHRGVFNDLNLRWSSLNARQVSRECELNEKKCDGEHCIPIWGVCCEGRDGGWCDDDEVCVPGEDLCVSEDSFPDCDEGMVECDSSWCISSDAVCCDSGFGSYCGAGATCVADTDLCEWQIDEPDCGDDEMSCGAGCIPSDAECCDNDSGAYCPGGSSPATCISDSMCLLEDDVVTDQPIAATNFIISTQDSQTVSTPSFEGPGVPISTPAPVLIVPLEPSEIVQTAVPIEAQTDPESACFLQDENTEYFTTPEWYTSMGSAAQSYYSSAMLNQSNTPDCFTTARPSHDNDGDGDDSGLSNSERGGVIAGSVLGALLLGALLFWVLLRRLRKRKAVKSWPKENETGGQPIGEVDGQNVNEAAGTEISEVDGKDNMRNEADGRPVYEMQGRGLSERSDTNTTHKPPPSYRAGE